MLKHSISQSHYGTTGGIPMSTPPHPLTSSSHSGEGSVNRGDHRVLHPGYQEQRQQFQGTTISDPTKYLEGHVSPTHPHSHSQSYLDQSFPSIHNHNNTSRHFFESSSNTVTRPPPPHRHHHHHRSQSQSHHTTPTSPISKQNGSIFFTPPPQTQPAPVPPNIYQHHPDVTLNNSTTHQHHPLQPGSGNTFRQGVLRSLSLLSILSLLLALNSLVFLLKIVWPLNMSGGGNDSEFKLMYEVTLCLAAMCLSISLCVLLVTSAQYFFAVSGSPGTTTFLHKVTLIRAVAAAGFFISIPLFLAAIVLYTFTHLSFAIPALVTTGIVGLAIIFGGCAMVYHVFTWQKEKTNKRIAIQDVSPNPTIELSTLV